MSIELQIAGGSRDGHRETFDKSLIAIGRHPLSDLRFDPEKDRDVSSRHAEIRVVDGRAVLHDLQSTNGTFVNGERLTAERPLAEGDIIAFGDNGPRLTVKLVADGAHAVAMPAQPRVSPPRAAEPVAQPGAATPKPTTPKPAASRAAPPKPSSAPPPGAKAGPGRTTQRIAMAVSEHTRQLRYLLYAVTAVLLIAVVGVWYAGKRQTDALHAALEAQIAKSEAQQHANDSLAAMVKGRVAQADSAYQLEKQKAESLQTRLTQYAANGGSSAAIETLRHQIDASQGRQRQIVQAAQVDFTRIAQANNAAVAMIAVEMPNGDKYTGSGFSVTSTGMVVTNRHLVRDDDGSEPQRIAVIFAGTKSWFPAHVVRVSDDHDLAYLQMDRGCPCPVVSGIERSANTVPVGSPIAIIGYPGGLDLKMEGTGTHVTAAPSLTVGTTSKLISGTLQIDAFAEQGSSGSPVFDRNGFVVGIVYGGPRAELGRVVYAIPVDDLVTEAGGQVSALLK